MSEAASNRSALGDTLALLERGDRVECIDGEIVHSAPPAPAHGEAQVGVAAALAPFRLGGGGGGRGVDAGWWILSEVEVEYRLTGEVFRHDLVGYRRAGRTSRPGPAPIRERADWVCEILSPSTARTDLVQKQRTLHAHGVPHYWIVDPEHQTLSVLRHGPDGYVSIVNAGVGDRVRAEPFDAIEIEVGEIFGGVAG